MAKKFEKVFDDKGLVGLVKVETSDGILGLGEEWAESYKRKNQLGVKLPQLCKGIIILKIRVALILIIVSPFHGKSHS